MLRKARAGRRRQERGRLAERLGRGGLAALVLVCVAAPAFADEDDYSRDGCYVGAGAAWVTPNQFASAEREFQDVTGVRPDVDPSVSYQGRVGCRGRWFGVEGHIEWIDGFDFKANGTDKRSAGNPLIPPAIAIDEEISGWLASGNLRFYPFTGFFQPFVNVGLGYLAFDWEGGVDDRLGADDWDFAARLGGGLELYMTRNVALDLDLMYVIPTSHTLDGFDYLSLSGGLLYRF